MVQQSSSSRFSQSHNSLRGKSTLRKGRSNKEEQEEKEKDLGGGGGGSADAAKSEKLRDLESYLANRYQAHASLGVAAGVAGERGDQKKRKKRRKKSKSGAGGEYSHNNLSVTDVNAGGIPSAGGGGGVGGATYDDLAAAAVDEDAPLVVNAKEVEEERELNRKRNVIRSNQRWQTVSNVNVTRRMPTAAAEEQEEQEEQDGRGRRRERERERERERYDSSPDLSPPRRPVDQNAAAQDRHDSDDSDRDDSDLDVPRRQRRERYDSGSEQEQEEEEGHAAASDSDSDLDVRRRGRTQDSGDSDSDLDVRRRTKPKGRGGASDEDEGDDEGDDNGGRPRMLDGTSTGLVSSKELALELERKRLEKVKKFEQMDPTVSGKNAQTVYRDRSTGARLSKDELAEKERDKQNKHEKPMWSAGLAQQKKRRERYDDLFQGDEARESSYNSSLKDRHRFGDPMAHLVSKKHKSRSELDEAAAESDQYYQQRYGVSLKELQSSGYVIPVGVPPHSWLKRGVNCPENRFGIRPGRFWDGVNRSNGFEKDYFKERNKQKHKEQLAFMWSQEDI